MYALAAVILRENRLERGSYVEPYAGGGGLALSLLFGGHVSDIHINDLDPSVWCFWDSVLNRTEQFVQLIQRTSVTIKEWQRQRKIHKSGNTSRPLELGFATFFLNRTNRSGVIKGAGVIGGLNQKGNYKIDCRFNREDLVRRVKRVAKYRSRIHLTNLDAIQFMKAIDSKIPAASLYCIDPPYYSKGSSLYTNFYGPNEHERVSSTVLALRHPWIVTYDDVEEIRAIYRKRRQFSLAINYSIQTKRVGSELLIASKGLRLPKEVRDGTFVAAHFAIAS